VQAYLDCRRTKRNTASALAFEAGPRAQPRNALHDELRAGTYRPGRSICFVVTRPKPREVWAADFRDRVVHHLLYNRIAPRFYAPFIADTCACIPGRGTLYAARASRQGPQRHRELERGPPVVPEVRPRELLRRDRQAVLRRQLAARVTEPWWLWLAE
jgi:RNA-directed DNA polymerase